LAIQRFFALGEELAPRRPLLDTLAVMIPGGSTAEALGLAIADAVGRCGHR
jgi:hypothetical protein